MGSDSDWELVKSAVTTLHEFGLVAEVRVISAHRTPEVAARFARTAARRGIKVILAAAGGAAHLAGAVAARTALPVIGVPLAAKDHDGMDALLSTVQMPRGVPVATVAINGATNAAILAAQILAVRDPTIRVRMHEFKDKMDEGVASVPTVAAAGAGGDAPA